MGLDTSHDCWHGSYTGFQQFRQAIADVADRPYLIGKGYPRRCYQGWWDEDYSYEDILDVFFIHSDCDGYIFPKDAAPLADRLDELVVSTPDDWRDLLRQFIAGLRKAVENYEIVEFH